MKRLLFVIQFFASLSVFCQKAIVYDENAVLRNVAGSFHSIRVTGGIDVFLAQSDTNLIAVSATKEFVKHKIITEIKDGELYIGYGNTRVSVIINGDENNRKVYVSYKNIDKIEASGSSDVYSINTIAVDNLQLNFSGSSDFKGEVVVNNLSINLSGASDASLEGKANNVMIDARGSSDVNAFELKTDTCDAKLSGSSDVSISVNKKLTAKASGSSDISYIGNPLVVIKSISGSSTVTKKED